MLGLGVVLHCFSPESLCRWQLANAAQSIAILPSPCSWQLATEAQSMANWHNLRTTWISTH